jgi:hypothetical protein
VGPIAKIETILDGVQMELSRGDSVDVSERQAAKLDRDTVNWAKPKASPSDKKKDGDS